MTSLIDPRTLAALVAARTRRGWTQRSLALRLGVTQSTVAEWETGKAMPTPARWRNWRDTVRPGLLGPNARQERT